MQSEVVIPSAFKGLFESMRYKVYYGGRGGAKSWAFANALLILGAERKLRILCARELQNSIGDSVHRLLADQVYANGMDKFYEVQKSAIIGANGTEFLFKGLKHNIQEIKSTEGVDICWVEEAQMVSRGSYEILIPTIRKPGSEIWVSFNPKNPTDATYELFIAHPREDSIVKKVSWRDNPFFPDVLDKERLHMLATDPEAYQHIWEGDFDTRFFGGIYAQYIAKGYEDGRIGEVPYDKDLPLYTAWDLGYDDATAIWWWQLARNEIRLIDYYEDRNKDLEFYCNVIKSRYTQYAGHYVPHDAANKLLAAGGRSIYEQMLQQNLKNVHVIPATSQQNSIEAARETLKITWIDRTKCDDGINALKQYQFEYDEDLQTFKSKPIHNWASHASDAFEIIGQVWRNPPVPAAQTPPRWVPTFNELVARNRQERLEREG